MGQGYSLTTLSAGSAGIDVPELADLTYEKSLGTARFMKSIRARQKNGLVFVKVIMKPYPSMKLDPYVKAILRSSTTCLQQSGRSDFITQENEMLWQMFQMRLGINEFLKPAPGVTSSANISTAHFMIE